MQIVCLFVFPVQQCHAEKKRYLNFENSNNERMTRYFYDNSERLPNQISSRKY